MTLAERTLTLRSARLPDAREKRPEDGVSPHAREGRRGPTAGRTPGVPTLPHHVLASLGDVPSHMSGQGELLRAPNEYSAALIPFPRRHAKCPCRGRVWRPPGKLDACMSSGWCSVLPDSGNVVCALPPRLRCHEGPQIGDLRTAHDSTPLSGVLTSVSSPDTKPTVSPH